MHTNSAYDELKVSCESSRVERELGHSIRVCGQVLQELCAPRRTFKQMDGPVSDAHVVVMGCFDL